MMSLFILLIDKCTKKKTKRRREEKSEDSSEDSRDISSAASFGTGKRDSPEKSFGKIQS